MAVSGIILAGGLSSRMGRDKTLLLYNNETLIKRTLRKLQTVADEIIIASNNTAKYNISDIIEVPDTYPGMGPLGGMHAGLSVCKHNYAFIVSCDMPLFSEDLASYLLAHRQGFDVVIPEIHNRLEPLCAVYSTACIKPIERCLQAGISKVIDFYPAVKVNKIGEQEICPIGNVEEIFYNLNTPQDLYNLGKISNKVN